MRIAVVGGSAAGMFTALLLARDGHDVVVVDRDDVSPSSDVDEAAASAFRAAAPQIVQPHGILSLCRELMREWLPDVYKRSIRAGIAEAPLAEQLPPTLPRENREGDERLTAIRTRRSTFDWVLRQVAAEQPDVRILRSSVRQLVSEADLGGVPRITGVATDDGPIAADLVVDASGRRGQIDGWLDTLHARPAPLEQAECGLAYYSRHYVLTTYDGLPAPATSRVVAELPEFTAGLWGGDNGTMQMAICPLVEDKRFRTVTDVDVYTNVLRRIGPLAPWLDVLQPITDIYAMGGLHNTLRRLVDDQGPIIAGLVGVGDIVCCTNPTLGRGLSLALQNAVDLVDAVRETGGDPAAVVSTFDDRVTAHVEPFFRDQARTDAARLAALRANHAGASLPTPPVDPGRVTFAELRAAAAWDADVFRACFSLMGMLVRPDDVYTDPQVVERARAVLRDAPPAAMVAGPSHEQLTETLSAVG
ncbi:MAG TPA: FAD-dependent oxidoreductase [Mycobacteriales bacterium]|nr:FAD-dependent oxidoreductase [Mycobacteriales bacterium]